MSKETTAFPWTVRLGRWLYVKTGWNGLHQFAYGRWLNQ